MEREHHQDETALIDLGVASVETRGPGGVDIDPVGKLPAAGISDD